MLLEVHRDDHPPLLQCTGCHICGSPNAALEISQGELDNRTVSRGEPTAWLTRQSRSNLSLHQNSLLTGKLTGNFADWGEVLQV
jgi:hypothetical protein